jgi:hypothetical protein
MSPHFPQLHPNSAAILGRQQRAQELRAAGLTIREIAVQLECSPYVAQTLLSRAHDRRVEMDDTGWLEGLPHRAARILLTQGYKTKDEVVNALSRGDLTSDQPGVGRKTLEVLAQWLATEEEKKPPQTTITLPNDGSHVRREADIG